MAKGRGSLPFQSRIELSTMGNETNCVYIMSTFDNKVLYTGVFPADIPGRLDSALPLDKGML